MERQKTRTSFSVPIIVQDTVIATPAPGDDVGTQDAEIEEAEALIGLPSTTQGVVHATPAPERGDTVGVEETASLKPETLVKPPITAQGVVHATPSPDRSHEGGAIR